MAFLTPVPASSSSVAAASPDVVESRFGQLTAVSTTSPVTVTVTSNYGYFSAAVIARTAYSTAGVVETTSYSLTPNQITVSRVVYSAPIVVRSVTQYTNVVPSNTTVWDMTGAVSSLLAIPSQSGLASYSEAVVADSEN